MVKSEVHLMLLLNDRIGTIELLSCLGDLIFEPLYDLLTLLIDVIEILKLILAHAGDLFLHLHYLRPLLLPLLLCYFMLVK